jgi:hypothetical protein
VIKIINQILDKIRAAGQWLVDQAEQVWNWASKEVAEMHSFVAEAIVRRPNSAEFEVWKRIIPYFLTSGVTILIIQASTLSPLLGLVVVVSSLVLFVVTYKWATQQA